MGADLADRLTSLVENHAYEKTHSTTRSSRREVPMNRRRFLPTTLLPLFTYAKPWLLIMLIIDLPCLSMSVSFYYGGWYFDSNYVVKLLHKRILIILSISCCFLREKISPMFFIHSPITGSFFMALRAYVLIQLAFVLNLIKANENMLDNFKNISNNKEQSNEELKSVYTFCNILPLLVKSGRIPPNKDSEQICSKLMDILEPKFGKRLPVKRIHNGSNTRRLFEAHRRRSFIGARTV